jgi:hypothetical protein
LIGAGVSQVAVDATSTTSLDAGGDVVAGEIIVSASVSELVVDNGPAGK